MDRSNIEQGVPSRSSNPPGDNQLECDEKGRQGKTNVVTPSERGNALPNDRILIYCQNLFILQDVQDIRSHLCELLGVRLCIRCLSLQDQRTSVPICSHVSLTVGCFLV